MLGGDFVKEFLGMMRTPLDWGVAGTSALVGAGADAYFNVLTPAFFDPTMTSAATLVAALSVRAFWKHGQVVLQSRRQRKILIPYLESVIATVDDDSVAKAFETDLKLADGDPAKLDAIRVRVETYRAAQLAEQVPQARTSRSR